MKEDAVSKASFLFFDVGIGGKGLGGESGENVFEVRTEGRDIDFVDPLVAFLSEGICDF